MFIHDTIFMLITGVAPTIGGTRGMIDGKVASFDDDDGFFDGNLIDLLDPRERSLIVGGYEIEAGSRPYLVNLRWGWESGRLGGCGASLISPHAVLTAAHCLVDGEGNGDDSQIYVDINLHSKDEIEDGTSEWREIYDYKIHPEYNFEDGFVDAAVMFFREEVTSVEPVILNEDPDVPADGDPLDVSGWGDTSGWGGSPAREARAVTVYAMDNKKCMSDPFQYENGTITDEMMCVFNEDGKSNCKGDSGGPHVLGNGGTEEGPQFPFVQVGIVSWGSTSDEIPCNSSEYPRVVTRVSSIALWIKETVCNETMELCDDDTTRPPTEQPTPFPSSYLKDRKDKPHKTSKPTKKDDKHGKKKWKKGWKGMKEEAKAKLKAEMEKAHQQISSYVSLALSLLLYSMSACIRSGADGMGTMPTKFFAALLFISCVLLTNQANMWVATVTSLACFFLSLMQLFVSVRIRPHQVDLNDASKDAKVSSAEIKMTLMAPGDSVPIQ